MILNKIMIGISLISSLYTFGSTNDQLNFFEGQDQFNDDEYYQHGALRISNWVYKPNIKTPKLLLNNEELSDPYLELNSEDQFHFYFDDLNSGSTDYSFTVYHCTHDWNLSELMPSEYIEGFSDEVIDDYALSFNTYISYTNYHFTFPNEDMRFIKSGNYLLVVYENNDKEQPIISKKFTIYEDITNISAATQRPADVNEMLYKQEVNFTLDYSKMSISDPFQEIKIAVLQNNRWDNAIVNLEPQFIQNDILIYNYNEACSFEGGYEFRYLDLKSTEFKGEKIDHIELEDDTFDYYLLPEESVGHKRYVELQDINGRYLISDENAQDVNTDADYVNVFFKLKADDPYKKSAVYVFGGLSEWRPVNTFRMLYDTEQKAYTLNILLKQGYYNYHYALINKNGSMDITEIEGSHQATENDYTIIAYQKVFNEGYDRAIGLTRINSRVR